MSSILKKLFGAKGKKADGLSQPQREAIVDLLHYCMYADNHLALNEDQVVSDEVDRFNWDPAVSYEAFAVRSISRVRDAKEHPESRGEFLASIAKALKSKAAKQRALLLCRQIFQADGDVAASESELLRDIQRALS